MKIKPTKSFWQPTKFKILLSAAVSFLFIAISRLVLPQDNSATVIIYLNPIDKLQRYIETGVIIIGAFFIFALYAYPLACFIAKLTKEYTKKKLKALTVKNILLLLLFFLAFNPLTLTILFALCAYSAILIGFG